VTRTALLLLTLTVAVPAGSALGAGEPTAPSIDQIDWGKVPEYRIVPGDELRFNFGPAPPSVADLTREATVRIDGRVTVFPVGDVVAAGRTPAELQADLLRLLAAEYKQPRVTVEVYKAAGNQVHVLGRVKQSGSKPMGPFPTLLQVIAEAGGFEDDAARNSVLIMHRDGANSVRVARVRVDRLFREGGDVALSRFDIIYVPRSTIGNVDIFVHQFFTETSSVLDVAMVGWELFNLERVFVLRTQVR